MSKELALNLKNLNKSFAISRMWMNAISVIFTKFVQVTFISRWLFKSLNHQRLTIYRDTVNPFAPRLDVDKTKNSETSNDN